MGNFQRLYHTYSTSRILDLQDIGAIVCKNLRTEGALNLVRKIQPAKTPGLLTANTRVRSRILMPCKGLGVLTVWLLRIPCLQKPNVFNGSRIKPMLV